MRANTAASISADMRAIIENGEDTRRMAKIGQPDEIAKT
jgi:hypothetical protein